MTDQVNFESNDPEVAEVSEGGLVRARQPGETAIVIRAAGRAATVVFGVIGQPLADYPQVSQRNFIDRLVFAKLRRLHILPSEPSDDQPVPEAGLPGSDRDSPPAAESEGIFGQRSSRQAGRADRDLAEFSRVPGLLDLPDSPISSGSGRRCRALPSTAASTGNGFRDGIARNKPYDQMARERIAAQGYGGPALHYYLIGGRSSLSTRHDG